MFFAVQHVVRPVTPCRGPDADGIASRVGFGEAVGGNLLPLGLRPQVALLLGVAAPGKEREGVQAGMHRHDDPKRGVHVFEFLAGEPHRDVVEPGAAVALGNRDPQDAQFAESGQDLAVEHLGGVVVADMRRYLAGGEVADQRLRRPVLLIQIEVQTLSQISSCLSGRSCGFSPLRLRPAGGAERGVYGEPSSLFAASRALAAGGESDLGTEKSELPGEPGARFTGDGGGPPAHFVARACGVTLATGCQGRMIRSRSRVRRRPLPPPPCACWVRPLSRERDGPQALP